VNRLRRTVDFPTNRDDVFHGRNRLPRLLGGPWEKLGYNVRYKQTQLRKLWGDEDDVVSLREVVARVKLGGKTVGALKFVEWHCEPWAEPEEFIRCMDGWSKEAADLADVVCCNWDLQELFETGPVVEFRLAWSHPTKLQKGTIWDVAKSCIELLEDYHSVLLLKAFPLEYEGNSKGNEFAMAKRTKAMQRMYLKVLGVEALPKEWGNEGWMWRKNNSSLEVMQIETD
jgi:hypothetical protein